MDKEMVTNIELLKELRSDKGLSQADLSKETGITLGTIKSLETGRVQLNQENLEILTSFYGMENETEKFFTVQKKDTKVLTVAIHKGGAGKSTIVANLAYELADRGKKILLIDTDAQKNLSRTYSFLEDLPETNFHNAFINEDDISNHILKTEHENIDIVISSLRLATIERDMNMMNYREMRMKRILENVITRGEYDYIIIDTNPSLGMLNTSIFHATDEVLIPLEPSQYGIEGVDMFIEHFTEIKKWHEGINILGIVLNRVEKNTTISQDATDVLQAVYPTLLLNSSITKDVAIQKAQWVFKPLKLYLLENGIKKTNALSDFQDLASEIIEILEN